MSLGNLSDDGIAELVVSTYTDRTFDPVLGRTGTLHASLRAKALVTTDCIEALKKWRSVRIWKQSRKRHALQKIRMLHHRLRLLIQR